MNTDRDKYDGLVRRIRWCTVCGRVTGRNYRCSFCGYDASQDYSIYRTLGEIPEGTISTEERIRQQKKEQAQRKKNIWKEQLSAVYEGKLQTCQQEIARLQEQLDILYRENEELKKDMLSVTERLADVQRAEARIKPRYRRLDGRKLSTIQNGLRRQLSGDAKDISFGRYTQNDKMKSEPIQWIVLNRSGEEILLLSKYILDCRQYHSESDSDVAWEDCDLRRWLGTEFIARAFSAEEQSFIQTVRKENNLPGRKSRGIITEDRIFLLSRKETGNYLPTSRERAAQATRYALKQGIQEISGKSRWWLRSAGTQDGSAVDVDILGYPDSSGCSVTAEGIGVRPALCISLKPINLK